MEITEPVRVGLGLANRERRIGEVDDLDLAVLDATALLGPFPGVVPSRG
jgi:hypothetical protein